MYRRQLRWIFSLTAVATLAIVGLQAYIWKQGIDQERDRFSRYLYHAVYEAAEAFMQPHATRIMLAGDATADTFAFRRPGFIALQIGLDSLSFTRKTASVEVVHDFTAQHDTFQAGRWTDTSRVQMFVSRTDSMVNNVFVRELRDCPTCETGYSTLSKENFKPLLEEELARLEIDSEFQWGVQHFGNWLIMDGDSALVSQSQWKIPFFTFPMGSLEHALEMRATDAHAARMNAFTPPTLSLYFPGERWHLLRNMGPTLLASSLLALLVMACIGYALHVILKQKQLSEVKTDFINNMTHEFKTPISTIALACEAMQDTGVKLPPASRSHYLEMISTENARLAAQVEKVLQMALLDKKDLGLSAESVSIHSLLKEIIEAFSLQVEQRDGSITAALDAKIDIVTGDAMHLRQMFTNLLDNANKYSPEPPRIRIETKTIDSGIEIAFHDRGLGINREALRKVFDRFYRVPTGNLHDVKGFGLGLSYVQTMALAHGGRVHAKSKPGAGSSFYLYLPCTNA